MNEWLYRNSMTEYEQKLRATDNERRALKIAAPLSINKLIANMVAGVRLPQSQPAVRLRRNS